MDIMVALSQARHLCTRACSVTSVTEHLTCFCAHGEAPQLSVRIPWFPLRLSYSVARWLLARVGLCSSTCHMSRIALFIIARILKASDILVAAGKVPPYRC